MSEVQAFAYRVPRFRLEIPLTFRAAEGLIAGVTKDLSEQGILARLEQPVLPGVAGRVRLQVDNCSIELEAQVAYAELCEVGLRFRFASREERDFVATLAKILARNLKQNASAALRA